MSIEEHFELLSKTHSDINEHLPTLSKYASECETVFETGVRGCVSSWALANGLLKNNSSTKKLMMNDISPCEIGALLDALVGTSVEATYEWKPNLELELPHRFDMIFIDTWHVYAQLKRELAKFAPMTNKFILMHDTTVDEWKGETIRQRMNAQQQSKETGFPLEEINLGLWPAIEEFLAANPEWVLHERYTNNNGLTVLRKVDV